MSGQETYRVTTWDMPACGPPEVVYEGPDKAEAMRVWESLPFARRQIEIIEKDAQP
jgi:hypothetical protein